MVGGELGSLDRCSGAALAVLTLRNSPGDAARLGGVVRCSCACCAPVRHRDHPTDPIGARRSGIRRMLLLMGGLVVAGDIGPAASHRSCSEEQRRLVAATDGLFRRRHGWNNCGRVDQRSHRAGAVLLSVRSPPRPAAVHGLEGWIRFPFLALAAPPPCRCTRCAWHWWGVPRDGLANALYLSTVFVVSSGAAVVVGVLGDGIGLHSAFVVSALITVLSVPLILALPEARRRR
jgi:hypothetical protein